MEVVTVLNEKYSDLILGVPMRVPYTQTFSQYEIFVVTIDFNDVIFMVPCQIRNCHDFIFMHCIVKFFSFL